MIIDGVGTFSLLRCMLDSTLTVSICSDWLSQFPCTVSFSFFSLTITGSFLFAFGTLYFHWLIATKIISSLRNNQWQYMYLSNSSTLFKITLLIKFNYLKTVCFGLSMVLCLCLTKSNPVWRIWGVSIFKRYFVVFPKLCEPSQLS